MVQLKKASSKYIIRSSLKRSRELRRRFSWSSAPSGPRERPIKRVIDNDLTVKSLSDLELPIPLSELKRSNRAASIELSDTQSEPSTTTTMSYQDIAVWIDKKSRIFFPLCFLIFNVVYWSLLFVPQSP